MIRFSLFVFLFAAPLCQAAVAPFSDDEFIRAGLRVQNIRPLRSLPKPHTPLFQLGRKLFFDKRLSGNRNVSCASCHHPNTFSHDQMILGLGEGADHDPPFRRGAAKRTLPRHTPALFNMGQPTFLNYFWDGRVAQIDGHKGLTTPEPALNGKHPARKDIVAALSGSLAAQALFPLVSEKEMRGQKERNTVANAENNLAAWAEITRRVVRVSAYRELLEEAFPLAFKFNIGHIASALAEFQMHAFRADNTPFDRYLAGDESALTGLQKKGLKLFLGKSRCASCHNGPHLSDFQFHNLAVPQFGPGKFAGNDRGREEVTGKYDDRYRFRTPTLRNIALIAPYMHNGAYNTLTQVIEHHLNAAGMLQKFSGKSLPTAEMRSFFVANQSRNIDRLLRLSPVLEKMPRLTKAEIHALESFLSGALTDKRSLNLNRFAPDRFTAAE